ncbi:preprotein translocase subunit SecD [Nocardia seriolae]|uniref:Protein translocase subunit SecD n=1 Tax=Nocardia seriolae TaxID=37332 RepID=A0ABC9Z022_9NOCA|nr:protein-export membrane protein SecD [Nocardia seriolae]BAW07811.1 preprotein translocase subunit SecD [Nocardia seriolae]GAM48795.1 preprotein translocase subunit SecD [Nocardia seriolae]GAP30686.1 preprotein translocase subunit SecD [Nocardia seriolae]
MRLLGVYAALVALMFGLIFFTGDKVHTPKLGIDLQGGTRVTLTARTPDGGKPSQDSLKKAQDIIEKRVNGLGVAGSEVVIEGDNLVITVPGEDGAQAKSLATTAKLYVRPMLNVTAPQVGKAPQQPAAGQPTTPAPATDTATPTSVPAAPSAEAPAPQNRVFPAQGPTTPSPTPTPKAPNAQQTQQEIAAAKALRQSTDQTAQLQAMATMDCSKPDPLQGNDDPNLPLVTCNTDGTEVYLLDKSKLDGQEIKDASGTLDTRQGRWVVNVEFKSSGSDAWGNLTNEYVGKQLAFALDTKVVSAPRVASGGQFGGSTQISGNFNGTSAKELANSLKYGSLPLSFATSEAETVSATLGLSSLRAGLIAGAIGLVAVLIYCLLYYRMLGFLAGFSLLAAGVAVYALIVLLGRWIGFTLDLAGIAGLIIGIGMTADSFVVFFERIKDQMREGRSFRSAVPRGWQRAQRTNLSGKTVSLIASAVLYLLAAGQVKGFAFTLGLTTVLDVIVLYLVTAPLMMLVSRSPFWAKPSVNGLGAIAELAQERKATAGVLVKEA